MFKCAFSYSGNICLGVLEHVKFNDSRGIYDPLFIWCCPTHSKVGLAPYGWSSYIRDETSVDISWAKQDFTEFINPATLAS